MARQIEGVTSYADRNAPDEIEEAFAEAVQTAEDLLELAADALDDAAGLPEGETDAAFCELNSMALRAFARSLRARRVLPAGQTYLGDMALGPGGNDHGKSRSRYG